MAKALVIKSADFSANALGTIAFDDIPCTGITISGDTVMLVGDTQRITAVLTPATTTDTVTWMSSNNSIATVTGGQVTCVSNGTVVITAVCGNHSATLSITCVAIDMIKGKAYAPSVGYVSDSKQALIVPNLIRVPYGATVTCQLTDTTYQFNFQLMLAATHTEDTITFTTSGDGKDPAFTRFLDTNKSDGAAYTYNPWTDHSASDAVYFAVQCRISATSTALSDADVTAIKAALSIHINHQAV